MIAWVLVAGVDLSTEARAIESLIDSGQKEVAGTRLKAACVYLGRRPEFRYLVCLYDARFHLRPDGELLGDVTDLVGEQPELVEATALLAELHARAGDGARAGLFARAALESKSPAARARAMDVLTSRLGEAKIPSGAPEEIPAMKRSPASGASSLSAWFERARRELVHRRSPAYGVRPFQSVVEMLIDWGQTVSEGNSFLWPEPLPLNRGSLAVVDHAILTLRRELGRRAAQSDDSRTMAVAGFFLAVVLHELEASVLEISPDDGGCKVLLPSGAGVRPLFVATAHGDGSGPTLVQTFDRLAAARELSSGPPSSGRMRRVSSGRMPVGPPGSKPSMRAKSARDELAQGRAQTEVQAVRALDRPTWPADPPPFDLPHIAAALAHSPLGQEIAARSGAFLAPTPASVEALESYCTATRGEGGAAPDADRWQTSDEEEELILAWGALLGETLISAYGGLWECDPSAPSDLRLFRVICQDRVAAWPMTQVYLRLRDGTRHHLVAFLEKVGSLLT